MLAQQERTQVDAGVIGLIYYTCSVEQPEGVGFPTDHNRYCIVIENLSKRTHSDYEIYMEVLCRRYVMYSITVNHLPSVHTRRGIC